MKLLKIAALFLLSISTHAALAGEVKPYSQAEFNRLASEGKPILLDFRADWLRHLCSARACDPGIDGAKQVQRPDEVHH